jgi:hypothetical protein
MRGIYLLAEWLSASQAGLCSVVLNTFMYAYCISILNMVFIVFNWLFCVCYMRIRYCFILELSLPGTINIITCRAQFWWHILNDCPTGKIINVRILRIIGRPNSSMCKKNVGHWPWRTAGRQFQLKFKRYVQAHVKFIDVKMPFEERR